MYSHSCHFRAASEQHPIQRNQWGPKQHQTLLTFKMSLLLYLFKFLEKWLNKNAFSTLKWVVYCYNFFISVTHALYVQYAFNISQDFASVFAYLHRVRSWPPNKRNSELQVFERVHMVLFLDTYTVRRWVSHRRHQSVCCGRCWWSL